MKKSFDYHDPRAKNVIVKAMTESHMINHYRKIQNVIPYVDTNIRKKVPVQSCVVRCECGNRIHPSSDYSRWNLRQKEYKKTVENGVPCSRFRKCFNDNPAPSFKPYSKTGQSKLRFLTDIYHPRRARPSTSTKNEEDCCNFVLESDTPNTDDSRKIDSDHIELLKKITDDILNNSLYTSWELKKLFQEHIMSNEDLTEEEMQSEIDNLEQELRFADDNLSPRDHEDANISPLKPSSYLSLRLDNLNINPKTLLSIKEALNLRQTEDSFSQTYHDSISSVKSNDVNDDNPNDEMYNYPESIAEHQNYDQGEKPDLKEEDDEIIPDVSQEADDISDKDDLESLDDLSSIHSYQN